MELFPKLHYNYSCKRIDFGREMLRIPYSTPDTTNSAQFSQLSFPALGV